VAVPGFTVDASGLKVNHPAADVFRFDTPSRVWSCQSISAQNETVVLSGIGRSPLKLKADLWSPGVALYFHHGISLKLSSLACPYLSWGEGSVGPDVPTPVCRWLLVSFRDNQPPVLLAFVGKPESMKFVGKPGDWTLKSETSYAGWVRFVTPIGTVPKAANSAQALGGLVAAVAKDAARWCEPAPRFKSLTIEDAPTAVTATWEFDKPGAMVPVAVALAPLGGYQPHLLSKVIRLDEPNECGPLTLCAESKLVVRFPVRRLPTGRSLAIGKPLDDAIGTVSSLDIAGVSELALTLLQSSRDELARRSGEDVLATYLTETGYVEEPITGKQLPFGVDGHGADLAAAHALLMQALYSTVSATSEPNSLLTSLTWRRDAYTWLFWADDPVAVRRTGALAALAGALCPEPGRRLDAALFATGVAAQRGLEVWKRRRGDIQKEPPLIEPLEAVRNAFFIPIKPVLPPNAYFQSIQSEIRVYGEQAVIAEKDKRGLLLSWFAQDSRPMLITFASAYPLELSAASVFEKFSVVQALGFTVVRCTPKDAGTCKAFLTVPSWASPLPAAKAPPRYSEDSR
jgi:hypothetical protein